MLSLHDLLYIHKVNKVCCHLDMACFLSAKQKQTLWPLVHKRAIPTERSPRVGKIYYQLLRIEGCHGVTAGPHTVVNLFSRMEPLLFFQVAPHLSSRGYIDPVPDPLLCRKFGTARNRTHDLWVSSQEL
jgi:hypothetical protein